MPQSRPRDGAPKPKKLLDQVRDRIRLKNDFWRIKQSYVSWVRRFIPHKSRILRRDQEPDA